MKKFVLFILILSLTWTCFSTASPTVRDMIKTDPQIFFEFSTDIEDGVALEPIYELFGTRIAHMFSIIEVLDIEVKDNWEIVNFQFIQNFTEEDTIIALFDAEDDVIILFLKWTPDGIPIDFSLVPSGFNRLYLLSDYQ